MSFVHYPHCPVAFATCSFPPPCFHSNSVKVSKRNVAFKPLKLTLTTHRTQSLGGLLLDPGQKAMLSSSAQVSCIGSMHSYHVEGMAAFAHEQSAIIAGKLARRTSAVELDATDAADVFFRHVPSPGSDAMPFLDCDFHCFLLCGKE